MFVGFGDSFPFQALSERSVHWLPTKGNTDCTFVRQSILVQSVPESDCDSTLHSNKITMFCVYVCCHPVYSGRQTCGRKLYYMSMALLMVLHTSTKYFKLDHLSNGNGKKTQKI